MKTDFPPDELKTSAPLEYLCRADEQGLLISPEESFEAFCGRLARLKEELSKCGDPALPEISAAVRDRADKIVSELYGFTVGWLPAFYSTRETGRFCAGVSEIADDRPPRVYLSGAFATRERHRGYHADETLAHESVHAARAAFPEDSVYDEYFACQVHASKFRRNAGNLFRRWYIPVLFFLGLNPFLFVLPLGILLREFQLRRRLRRAGERLRGLGLRPEPVLARLADAEIEMLAAGGLPAVLADGSSLRRRLFFRRFTLR